ncbi:tellurite resistance TerB family protein [Hyphomicrobium sp. CS1BSMeth3]|uniref:tellurite resistance TerB family protein n=1 Tax=Hyphomicrobium sp. CS1BSMeth3 TaxID=1892844 RepID=UPI00092FF98F|nr:tellurite resistance TerB family protein [Hyphomicrobium sp. CS1BSMeth3]
MFDAKSLLEMMVRGASPNSPNTPQAQSGQGGGLEDLLGQLLGGARQQGDPARGGAGNSSGIGALDDLMRQFSGGGAPASSRAAAPNAAPGASPGQGQGGGGFLDDLLRNLTQSQSGGSGGQGAGGGNLMDILGQILGQATSGAKEGAQRIDDATGASGQLRDILTRTTGKSPEELMNAAKELVEKNKLGAGAAAGGLGAVVLGTQTGRAIAGSAFKLGALALIGGLAYKAMQNYQAGKPVLGGGTPQALVEAPAGSGYEARAITHDTALLYIRAMIAAAAADGRIDEKEMNRIVGGLKQMGVDRDAEEFLANELNNPATPEELASAVHGEAEAVQVYTAARIAIDLDNEEEHDFLVRLANDLDLDQQLIAHIDATARQAA